MSGGRDLPAPVRPCLVAFREEARRPWGVVGPRERAPLRREAVRWGSVRGSWGVSFDEGRIGRTRRVWRLFAGSSALRVLFYKVSRDEVGIIVEIGERGEIVCAGAGVLRMGRFAALRFLSGR